MGGDHHHHVTGAAANVRGLALTLGLVLLYMAAEVVGGILANSLALLADAGHMLSDAAALGLSLFAIWLARRPSGPQATFGYYRTEILAALINGTALVVIALFVVWEAVDRFRDPPAVRGGLMMGVAAGGLVVNLIGLWLLHKGRSESLNIRGAWLHVLTDTLGSLQAIIAGALILGFGWHWADPVASCLIAVLVVYSAWKLLKETLAVIMEQAPGHIDVDEVRDAMLGVEGVIAVHDLHLWTITSGLECLSAHVVSAEFPAPRGLLSRIREVVSERFGIDHTTIQIEPEDFDESLVCD
jgi:cobalt-zinc-cadmium efflux system protein